MLGSDSELGKETIKVVNVGCMALQFINLFFIKRLTTVDTRTGCHWNKHSILDQCVAVAKLSSQECRLPEFNFGAHFSLAFPSIPRHLLLA